MNTQNSIWFVIVTYNPNKESLRRLMTVLEGRNTIIVDNTKDNIGYGARANQGMKRALGAGARWVVVCNQDITLTKPGVAHFIQVLEDCEPGVAGPEAGTLDPNRWTTVLASRHIRQAQCKPGLMPDDDRLLYISGSMMAIHNDVWQATQGFFEPYFLYYEDVDLSMRVKQMGFPLRHIIIEGFSHKSMRRIKEEAWIPYRHGDDKQMKEYYLARNHLLFVRRLSPVRVKIHELMRLPKTLVEHHNTGNAEAVKGIGDFAIGRFGEGIF